MLEHIYLACHHDRHNPDDLYKAFTNEADAKAQCHIWMKHWSDILEENHQQGDWCLYAGDSYYAFVQKVQVHDR